MTITPTPGDAAPHLNATRARSGLRGRHILWVLLISLVLVVIGLFGSWGFRVHDLAKVPQPGADAREAKTFDVAQPPV